MITDFKFYDWDDNLISDLHKDARGHRPSHGFMLMWKDLTPAQKQEKWDSLVEEMKQSQAEEQEMEKMALDVFRASLRKTMETCSVCWRKAMWFLGDAEGIDIGANEQEFEHFLWRQGIGYDDRKNIFNLYYEGRGIENPVYLWKRKVKAAWQG